jgi:hypothetical protein
LVGPLSNPDSDGLDRYLITVGEAPLIETFANGVLVHPVFGTAANTNDVVNFIPLNNPEVVTPVTFTLKMFPLMAWSVIVPVDVLWLLHVVVIVPVRGVGL